MDEAAAERHRLELLGTLSNFNGPFSLLVDLRHMLPVSPEVGRIMAELHDACLRLSLQRAAIIIESPIVQTQAVQIGIDAATDACDRVINAAQYPDWEQRALAWVTDGIEPFPKEPIAGQAE
jgi:hypothetical protein